MVDQAELILNMIDILKVTARDFLELYPDTYIKDKTPYETLLMLVDNLKEAIDDYLYNCDLQFSKFQKVYGDDFTQEHLDKMLERLEKALMKEYE